MQHDGERIGVALGYRDAGGWVTEGWWNLASKGCETLLKGSLAGRYYYVFAVDYDRGGEWSGRSLMCTRDREFTIRGVDDCLARATTATASSRSIPASRRAGRSSSPIPAAPAPDLPFPFGLLMTRARRTKIVATLGPASSDPEMIARLFEAGADVFRINISHLPRERLAETVATIRTVEQRLRRPIAVLVDLQGPKLRVGRFADDAAMLENGRSFVVDGDTTPGDATRVHLPHPEILSALEPGHTVIIDDGKLRLTVTEVGPERAVTRSSSAGGSRTARACRCPTPRFPWRP